MFMVLRSMSIHCIGELTQDSRALAHSSKATSLGLIPCRLNCQCFSGIVLHQHLWPTSEGLKVQPCHLPVPKYPTKLLKRVGCCVLIPWLNSKFPPWCKGKWQCISSIITPPEIMRTSSYVLYIYRSRLLFVGMILIGWWGITINIDSVKTSLQHINNCLKLSVKALLLNYFCKSVKLYEFPIHKSKLILFSLWHESTLVQVLSSTVRSYFTKV